MNPEIQAQFEARANIFKAVAHPTRLFIVNELSRQEKCVSELTEMVGADMSTVSRHLSVLKNAGVIIGNKRGGQVFYKLRFPCIIDFFSCIESVLRSKPEEQVVKCTI